MAKKMSKLAIMNTMGDAADKKAKMANPENDHDEDDMPAPAAKKAPKQAAAIAEKKKAPKFPLSK